MARKTFLQPTLNAEQQAESDAIYQQILGTFQEEARRMADLMASKSNHQLFGKTEFEIRDRVHELGASVLETVTEERVKKGARTSVLAVLVPNVTAMPSS